MAESIVSNPMVSYDNLKCTAIPFSFNAPYRYFYRPDSSNVPHFSDRVIAHEIQPPDGNIKFAKIAVTICKANITNYTSSVYTSPFIMESNNTNSFYTAISNGIFINFLEDTPLFQHSYFGMLNGYSFQSLGKIYSRLVGNKIQFIMSAATNASNSDTVFNVERISGLAEIYY